MCAFGTSSQPRGAALVIAMLVMAVLLLAGTTFLTISSTESLIALNERGAAQAVVLAEAAIHKALAQLNLNPSYSGEQNTPLGGGTFSITVTPTLGCTSNSARILVAVASMPVRGGQAQATLQAMVDQVSYPYRWALFAAVPNATVYWLWDPLAQDWVNRTDAELWIRGNNLVDSFDSGAGTYDRASNSGQSGNIGANGDVTLGYNSEIDGSVQAGDDIIKRSGVTVTGGESHDLSPNATDPGVQFPDVTPGTTAGGNLDVPAGGTVTLTKGTYYYTNMKFGDNASLQIKEGPVTIYVTGPPISGGSRAVNLGLNVTLGSHPGTQLRIITKSDASLVTRSDGTKTDHLLFVAQDGLRFYGSLYGKNTDVYLGASAEIYGSIIGRTITSRSQAKTHYDQAMSNQEICHNGKFTIRRGTWREVVPST